MRTAERWVGSPPREAAAATARRPGRPTGKADRRSLLLDAALTLFAQQGVQNTTLRMIADHVGLTAAMAHYYFHSREQLLDAVVEERLLPLAIRINQAFHEDGREASAMIAALVRRLLEAVEECPCLPPLWVREMLSEGGALRDRLLKRLEETGTEKADRRLESWGRHGVFSGDIEPSLVFISIVALTLLPLAGGSSAMAPVAREQLERHVGALLAGGLFAK
jgi:TetR/AcrR family transcriptional regulator